MLHQALVQTVNALSLAVETRDPYVSGHQQRVAQLAKAIAMEMDLPQQQIEGIHLAANLHDIGKINIPSGILSKPGRLNKLEIALIKNHSQVGYDILKGIDFPWPLALIVLQHHEKLDGSGYPQRLKADEIIIEAKIICVADVVEAMSSHRPYRPARGEEAAMEEIGRLQGIEYDAKIVNACYRLFKEKTFKFITLHEEDYLFS
jgi:putative nucleotidyltransferase with HDIG domain